MCTLAPLHANTDGANRATTNRAVIVAVIVIVIVGGTGSNLVGSGSGGGGTSGAALVARFFAARRNQIPIFRVLACVHGRHVCARHLCMHAHSTRGPETRVQPYERERDRNTSINGGHADAI